MKTLEVTKTFDIDVVASAVTGVFMAPFNDIFGLASHLFGKGKNTPMSSSFASQTFCDLLKSKILDQYPSLVPLLGVDIKEINETNGKKYLEHLKQTYGASFTFRNGSVSEEELIMMEAVRDETSNKTM